MSLTPTEIALIDSAIENSSLTEVSIEQNGERTVIGGATPAQISEDRSPVVVSAPAAGTVGLDAIAIGQNVAEGDRIARLRVLGSETPITAPSPGRIAAIFIEDGGLAAYRADLFLIEPEKTR